MSEGERERGRRDARACDAMQWMDGRGNKIMAAKYMNPSFAELYRVYRMHGRQ